MIKKNIIQNIADKEMDRSEFLKSSGLVLLGIFGFGAILNLLGKSSVDSKPRDSGNGFGGGRYGV